MNELYENNEDTAIKQVAGAGEIPAFLERKPEGDIALEVLDGDKPEGFVQVESDFK